MKKCACGFGVLFLLLYGNVFAQVISLRQCIEIALENSPQIKLAANEAQIAKQMTRQAKKDFLPQLAFTGNYKRQSMIPEIEIPAVELPLGNQTVPLFPGEHFTLGSLDTYDFRLNLSQPLFTGFKLRNKANSLSALANSKSYDLAAARSEVVNKVVNGYSNVLKAERFLDIARSGLEQVQTHLKDTEAFLSQGLARKTELLVVKVKESEAQLAVLQAQNGVEIAKAALGTLLGKPLPDSSLFQAPDIAAIREVQPDSSLKLAFRSRPELSSLELLQQSARFAEKAVRGNRLPNIVAIGSYGYGRPGLDLVNNEWMDYWVVGVNAEWSLWSWGKTSSQIQQAQLQVQSVQEVIRQTRLGIELDVRQACSKVNEALQRKQVAQQLVGRADETLRVISSSYKQGTASNTEYLDAQADLTRAQLQKAQAEIDCISAYADWQRAVGMTVHQQ
jgi:outer membrane protein